MPVSRVPVIHKFGIISPSHRLELQERLAQRTQLLKANNERLVKASKSPLEVTEDFVFAYNSSSPSNDPKKREKLDDKADKMLEKLKRQVGLKTSGVGNHVDIPIAWTDLTQLSQCKGRIQQECLDVLLVSLDQSPTSGENIPVLFFLAESVLYSLRTDVIYEPFLGSSEVKLFFIGQRVFARLFFHHMCGEMIEFVDLKRRLHTYLDGFLDSQKVYKPYPHILTCLRYMSAVGSIVIGDNNDDDDAGGGKEQEEEEVPKLTTSNDLPKKPLELGNNEPQHSASRTSSTALSSSVHELAPTLWHSLDVWRCVCSLGAGLSEALRTMRDCAVDLAMENWVDVICALDVLGDAARSNLETLTALQHIACGIRDDPPSQGDTDMEERDRMTDVDRMMDSRYMTQRLPAIAESEVSVKNKDGGLVQEGNHNNPDIVFHEADWTNSRSVGGAFASKLDHSDQLETNVNNAERDWTNSKSVGGAFSSEGRDSEKRGVTRFSEKLDVQNFTNDFDSNSSSLLSNQMATENAVVGLVSWRWELAVKYIEVLCHIVLCGSSSLIRRQALMGANEVADYIHQTASIVRSPLASAGLFDLLFFRTAEQEKSGKDGGKESDWGWRVRFATFLRLYQIHACLSRDQTTLGIRTVIWNIVERAEQMERDVRVLEALKVAQVDANLENLLQDHLTSAVPTNLGAKIAHGLMTVYLPPLPPPSSGSRPQTMRHTHGVNALRSEAPSENGGRTQRLRHPLRTSLRDEITLSNLLYQPTASYEKRTTKRLNYVIEDQWRKELERLAAEEQEAKLKERDDKEKNTRVKNKTS